MPTNYRPPYRIFKRRAEDEMAAFDALPKWARDLLNYAEMPQIAVGVHDIAKRFATNGLPEKLLQQYTVNLIGKGYPALMTEAAYGKDHPAVKYPNRGKGN